MTFDYAMVLSSFYRDYSDTNSIIEAAEKEAAEDADKLLSDTVSLLSEIEKFSAVGVAGIQQVDFERLFEQHVKPFEDRYEAAKAVSTKLWQEYSAMSNRLDLWPTSLSKQSNRTSEANAGRKSF